MKTEHESTCRIPRSTPSVIDNPRARAESGGGGTAAGLPFISGRLAEVLWFLLYWVIITCTISHFQRASTKFSTINPDDWTEGPTRCNTPCTSPNHGLKLARTPGSTGHSWSFLMLIDGPLVKNESRPGVVVQTFVWRACSFQEWMLETNIMIN